jgi:uncharacterized membrane protein
VLGIFVFPLIGVLAYLIVRGHMMHQHRAEDQARYEAFRQYTRGAASGSSADDVNKLAELRDRGVLTSEEFERAKTKALA